MERVEGGQVKLEAWEYSRSGSFSRYGTRQGSEFFAHTATQTADGDNLSSPDVVVVVDVNGSHYMLLGLEYNWIKIKFPRQCNGIMPPMMRMGWWILGSTSARMRGSIPLSFYSVDWILRHEFLSGLVATGCL